MKPFEKSLKTLKNLSKLKDLPLKLAETGEPVVNTEYAKVDGEYKEYITVIEQHPNETILAVMGEDVAFREFGAGIYTAEDYPTENASGLPPLEQGSWSREHAQKFSKNGMWWYKNRQFVGIRPSKGMYHASLTMREKLGEVVKELLK